MEVTSTHQLGHRSYAKMSYDSREFLRDDSRREIPSRDISEKCASCRSQILTQLYPINRNFTLSHYNIIGCAARLLPPSPSRTPAYMKLFELYRMQYDSPAGTSVLSAGHKQCVVRPAVAEAAVHTEHRLNLARQIGKIARRIDRRFSAMSSSQRETLITRYCFN